MLPVNWLSRFMSGFTPLIWLASMRSEFTSGFEVCSFSATVSEIITGR